MSLTADLAEGRASPFRSASWTGPRLVAAERPTTTEKKNELTEALFQGKDLEYLPRYYVDYAQESARLAVQGKSLAALRGAHPEAAPIIDRWLSQSGRNEADAVYLPLRSATSGLVMLLDPRTGDLIGVLPIDPW